MLQVVTPGDKPAQAMAIAALHRTAEESEKKQPEAARVLKEDTYMDDICSSVSSEAECEQLTDDVDAVLEKGGFKVKQWISNVEKCKDVEMENVMWSAEEQKVLGVVWDPGADVLKYKIHKEGKGCALTKRDALSELAKVYDPVGFASAFIIKGKIMMQQLWIDGVSWDEKLSHVRTNEWMKFLAEIKQLDGITFDRCLVPYPDAKAELVVFCDASEVAFGTVCYLRWKRENGDVGVRFVCAKARVSPLKPLTLPRLELQAAVLASRLAASVKKEMTVDVGEIKFFSDSIIALSWIRGQPRRWKSFVANRVAEIQCQSDPADWHHIPGEHNVADKISRGIPVDQLQGEWRNGPEFLKSPEEQWPVSQVKANAQEVDKEAKREEKVLIVKAEEKFLDAERFSCWRKLIRTTAYVFRFIANVKAKRVVNGGPLDVKELSDAEQFWVKEVQRELKPVENYKTLSPFMREGIVYVGGRTSNQRLLYETEYPALLPAGHHVSLLITRHMHEVGHYGVATTAAKVRRKYWIIGVSKLAKNVKRRCVRCKMFEPKAEEQWMADLPGERVRPFSPPFHCTAIDYFGPYEVKIGRNKTAKHYGVIFTCLGSGAVHLELATDCSTQEFLQVLRRFFALRGYPSRLQSDNGTQFIGAERQLRDMVRGWSVQELKEFCAEKQVDWKFVTPLAPHQNGCAESMVKSCKRALKKAVGHQRLTPFELHTCFQEVANLVNERPIGRIPNDPDDGSYICPNDLLLGRASSRVPQGPFRETRNPQHRVEFIQRIVDAFWKIWVRDVFPLLVPRRKWNVNRRNVSKGDIVVVADANVIRSQWKLGRVTDVYPGADGKVRNVKVQVGFVELQRPITKISVIYPAEGLDE